MKKETIKMKKETINIKRNAMKENKMDINNLLPDTILSTEFIISIIEATGRFNVVYGEMGTLVFWDNQMKTNTSLGLIGDKYTLDRLMYWIANFYSTESFSNGEKKAKTNIREALGI